LDSLKVALRLTDEEAATTLRNDYILSPTHRGPCRAILTEVDGHILRKIVYHPPQAARLDHDMRVLVTMIEDNKTKRAWAKEEFVSRMLGIALPFLANQLN